MTGALVELWRYPVKSVLGEPLTAVEVTADGLPPDVDALRVPARLHRVVPLPQLGPQPCVGAYAQVVRGGRVELGDDVEVC
ncbi:hypothetical protein JNW88_32135 [Micromonospora sp. ATA32]|nr:hypothetical protein [Micromonospora sp. ATA32]